MKTQYPFVECDHHRGKQRGYIVCCHVVNQERTPSFVELATDVDTGVILCPDCAESDWGQWPRTELHDRLKCVCEGCVINLGWLMPV